jgi:hypothetical protein
LDLLKRVFTYSEKLTRKEALWLVSNIAANSDEDATYLVDSDIIGALLLHCLDSAHDIRKEACWSLSNILFKVTDHAKVESLL